MNQSKRFSLLAPMYEFIHWGANRTVKRLLEVGDFNKADNVLDLGGGAGRIAKRMAPHVNQATVADVAEGMIAQCSKHEDLKCVLLTQDVLPFEDTSFDKVIMVDAFHHFANQEKAVTEVRRVLKEGGVVILQEMNTQTLYGRFANIVENVAGITHKFHTPDGLSRIWNSKGFESKVYFSDKGSYYLVARKNRHAVLNAG